MKKLKLELEFLQMLKNNKDGSFSTQQSRRKELVQIANDLEKMGFNKIGSRSLNVKHYQKLSNLWQDKGLTPATMRNRMSCLRWQANKNNLGSRVPTNKQLGIPDRAYPKNKKNSID